jgi:hypothetical protein
MKVLVVYFSRDGHTERMAKAIARRCAADLERIREVAPPHPWLGGLRSSWQALTRANPPIERPGRNPARYELVIIGTPVWRMGIALPVRSYVDLCRDRFKQVAFFCAEGDADARRGFDELARLCGQRPVATFEVDRKGLPPVANKQGLTDFIDLMRL